MIRISKLFRRWTPEELADKLFTVTNPKKVDKILLKIAERMKRPAQLMSIVINEEYPYATRLAAGELLLEMLRHSRSALRLFGGNMFEAFSLEHGRIVYMSSVAMSWFPEEHELTLLESRFFDKLYPTEQRVVFQHWDQPGVYYLQ